MATGLLSMTNDEQITKRTESANDFHKLSIQVSLDGLSFCILDTVNNAIVASKQKRFGKELTPYQIQKELQELIREYRVTDYGYSAVVVIHKNPLFSLVPKDLFDEKELANYMKFNVKILTNDMMAYDEIEQQDMVNVYVPFMNINNYIYELFGAFDYLHNGTVLIQALLQGHTETREPVCFVHSAEEQMDIIVLDHKKLVYFNSFAYETKEDFIYFLLFALEQLNLDPASVRVRLFGTVEEGDPYYDICYRYIQNVSLFYPAQPVYSASSDAEESIDFTVLNAL